MKERPDMGIELWATCMPSGVLLIELPCPTDTLEVVNVGVSCKSCDDKDSLTIIYKRNMVLSL